jgi:hypothetical protein
LFRSDTGPKTAKLAQVQPILMMNNPDEARRLVLQGPAGGIVSLYELPDFVRLLLSRREESPPAPRNYNGAARNIA